MSAPDDSAPGATAPAFNEQQQAAVSAPAGSLLIDAGPGSGKTQTMAGRTGDLIRRGADPHRILLLTFTKSAAQELVDRVKRLSGVGIRWSGTFHSICSRLLRRWGSRVGLREGFVIYDDDDQKKLLGEILRDHFIRACQPGIAKPTMFDIAEHIRHWIRPDYVNKDVVSKIFERERSDRDSKMCRELRVLANHLRDAFDWAKNENLNPSEFAAFNHAHPELLAIQIYPVYEQVLDAANATDFGGLMMHGVTLTEDIHAGPEIRSMFDHVLVDEFQDTNKVQQIFLKGLGSKSLTVVGDGDQSLYEWRSARPEVILDFEKEFEASPMVIKLEENYRSTGHIIKAANALIKFNKKRREKSIFTAKDDGNLISVVRFPDPALEAEFIARTIMQEHEAGMPYQDMAILYRQRGQKLELERGLRRFRVGYDIIGDLRFYDHVHIRDLLGYMKVTVDPLDSLSLRRVINVPARGIGPGSLARVIDLATKRKLSLLSALRESVDLPGFLSAKVRSATAAFLLFLNELRQHEKPAALVNHILDKTDWLRRGKEDEDEETERRADLKSVLDDVVAYETEADSPNVNEFLDQVALSSPADNEDDDADIVRLMTCHAAKGREYPLVFVTGLEQTVFPTFQAMIEKDLEEERRACYVAMTRAKRTLYMTYCGYRMLNGKSRNDGPSVFLDEVIGSARDHVQVFSWYGDGLKPMKW